MCLDFRIVPYWQNLSSDCQQCWRADRWVCWTNKSFVQSIQCYKQFIPTRQPTSSICTSWWWIMSLNINSYACFLLKYFIKNVDNTRSFIAQNKMDNLLKIMGRMVVYVLPVVIYVGVIFLKILKQTKDCWTQ